MGPLKGKKKMILINNHSWEVVLILLKADYVSHNLKTFMGRRFSFTA